MSETLQERYDSSAIISFLTTEHFTLQSSRGIVVSESVGRLNTFLTVLSAMMVALALIAQLSGIGDLFYTFALIFLPVVLFIGVVTLFRILQLSVIDLNAIRGMNRIRRFFVDVAPRSAQYLTLPASDDNVAVNVVLFGSGRGMPGFVGIGALVTILNSLLAGVFAAIVAARLSAAQPLVITTGIIGGVAMLILLLRIASRIILPIVHEEPRFPALDQEQPGE